MIRKPIIISLLTASVLSFSQTQIKVLDEETQKPVPYAKLILKDKNYYINAEESGTATLGQEEKISEIQSYGYENFKVEKYQNIYFLKPKYLEIDKVHIIRPKLSKTFTIGKIAKEGTFFGVNNTIWMVGKEFRNTISDEPLFIKSLSFYSRLNAKKSATIKLNIYYDENGVPGALYKSVIVTCFKNKKLTKYIFPKPFLFPQEGFIVAFEWILNEENSYQKVMTLNGEQQDIKAHDPLIGSVTEHPKNIIIGNLSGENWQFVNGSQNPGKGIGNIGIELELTN
ncbi:hypothetical protein [uncultured Chryseobacterium sp.]|uniref:hypothetical protein n=1 Tax=uncultured Chryseobacterium sp. TaxID=259322 RepID=UPI0025D3B157|nr:hypothetical protein [uncultured Chryseobacterium sp.]